jgi:hypothetical protein
LVQAIHSALISTACGCFEHVHRVFARRGGHLAHTPQGGDLGTVVFIAQVPMGAQQVGHAAHFAPAHGIGLPGQ